MDVLHTYGPSHDCILLSNKYFANDYPIFLNWSGKDKPSNGTNLSNPDNEEEQDSDLDSPSHDYITSTTMLTVVMPSHGTCSLPLTTPHTLEPEPH